VAGGAGGQALGQGVGHALLLCLLLRLLLHLRLRRGGAGQRANEQEGADETSHDEFRLGMLLGHGTRPRRFCLPSNIVNE
jgi:hypothetical protein